jgi:MFS family permease
LDQTGALLGPLLLAAILSWHDGDYRLAFGILAVPGVVLLGMLIWLRSRVPDPRDYETSADDPDPVPTPVATSIARPGLPRTFWQFVATVAVLSAGVASFPLLAFHALQEHLAADATIPLLFAVAMAVDGVSGFLVGRLYDSYGPRVLLAVPVAAALSAIAFTSNLVLLWVGVAIWGVVNGVLDSTVKAVVTDLVPSGSRAPAFGWLALVRGLGLLVAGAALGVAYEHSPAWAIGLIIGINAIALVGLATILAHIKRQDSHR